jgi:hypothetical protein
MMMRKSVFAFAVLFGLASGGSALAGDPFAGLELSRPALACLPHAQDMRVSGLWLGHFTGGRLVSAPEGGQFLDWRDDYSCFPTARACARWQRSLTRAYHSQEGYQTCLPLRGGGVPIQPYGNVVTAKY